MLQRSITDIIPLVLLVMFFGIQQRTRRQIYYNYWFMGWISVLLSYVAWGAETRGFTGKGLVEIVRLDVLLLASLLFLCSFLTGVPNLRRVVLGSLPIGITTVVLVNLQQNHDDAPRLMLLIAVFAWSSYGIYAAKLLIPGDWHLHRMLIVAISVIWGMAIAVDVWRTGAPDLSQWMQVEIFLCATVLYGIRHRRNTPAGVLATLGFILWAGFYAFAVWSQYLPVQPYLLHNYWNLPKYLVAFSMIQKISEDAQGEKSALAEQFRKLYQDFRLMYENHIHPMWIYDGATRLFLSANAAACDTYGFTFEEFQQIHVDDLVIPLNDEQQLVHLTVPVPPGVLRVLHRRKDGSTLWVHLNEQEILFQDKPAVNLMARDVTSGLDYNYHLVQQAHHDALTGLPNRKCLADQLAQAIERSIRDNKMTAVLTIDIDHFKKVNDTYGHPVGDVCLKAVAERLNSKIRKFDALAHVGGEEFVAVIGGLSSVADAERIAKSLLQLFEAPLHLPECDLPVTVSIGVAVFPNDGYEAETLYRSSDEALYAAKQAGRNRYVSASALETQGIQRAQVQLE